jgi:hypothetical protein
VKSVSPHGCLVSTLPLTTPSNLILSGVGSLSARPD